jgi:hypothetical protein
VSHHTTEEKVVVHEEVHHEEIHLNFEEKPFSHDDLKDETPPPPQPAGGFGV